MSSSVNNTETEIQKSVLGICVTIHQLSPIHGNCLQHSKTRNTISVCCPKTFIENVLTRTVNTQELTDKTSKMDYELSQGDTLFNKNLI